MTRSAISLTVCAALVSTLAPDGARAACGDFRRSDSNSDGKTDISDGITTLAYLFLGGPAPACLDAADANDTGTLDLTDAVYTFLYLFVGGAPPPRPGAEECGGDPTDDDLGCVSGSPCPGQPEKEVCNGLDDDCDGVIDCGPGFFCRTEPGNCASVAECAEVPASCPKVLDPVCGCDGITYGNECEAARARVGVAHAGECSATPCTTRDECDFDSYCATAEGDCDGVGVCTKLPLGCPDNVDPVCGCDGRSYSNPCDAAAMGVSIQHRGRCEVESCTNGFECPEGFYCAKAAGDCSGKGTCTKKPEGCTNVVDPVCGCDGSTYGNECLAAAAGVSVAFKGECESSKCTGNEDCPLGFFCQKAAEDCDGAGTCRPRPEICPLIFKPVCGCDRITYGNSCEAAAAGVNVMHSGPCGEPSCQSNEDCDVGFFCSHLEGDCLGTGTCRETPLGCDAVVDPVCGCDGVTYGNECEAAIAGVSVQFRGECEAQGCRTNEECEVGFYCEHPEGRCGDLGQCSEKPAQCKGIDDPVCGCDDVTYRNECEAAAAGVSINYRGTCNGR